MSSGFVRFTARRKQHTFDANRERFAQAAQQLRKRAARARLTRAGFGAFIGLLVCSAASLVFLRLTAPTAVSKSFSELAYKMAWSGDHSPDFVFLRRTEGLLDQLYPNALQRVAAALDTGKPPTEPATLSSDQKRETQRQVEELLSMYERASKVKALERPSKGDGDYTPIITTLAFSAGAITLVLLAISISVMFMRYYAQLAELYEAQAMALEASGGDPSLAVHLIKNFSPAGISLGKAPASLYEKSVETIASLSAVKR